MNRLPYRLNDLLIDVRQPQRKYLRCALCLWAVSHWIVVGCGSKVQDGETPNAPPAVARESSPTATRPPIEEVTPRDTNRVAGPTAAQVSPAAAAPLAGPTAEQLERWTPAPFEPLQLLAIREWEKTSFTGQLAPTPDGKHFITAGSRVLLWSVTGEEPQHVFLELSAAEQDRSILALDVSPDGKGFAAGDSTGTMRIWSLDDRREIIVKRLLPTGIQCLAISPDAQEIATISYDNEVTTWTAARLQQQNKFKVDTNGLKRIEYLAPSLLAAAGESTSLWNTSTGAVVQTLSQGRYSFALGRSPEGARFVFGGEATLHLWNVAEARQEAELSQGVSGSELLAFSPDGKFLATTHGRSVQLWNLAERRVVQVIDGFGWPVVGLSWLPQTQLLVVASDIGCNRIWGTASQGAAVGLQPLHAPVAMPDAASQTPATLAQLEQIIDLRTFPRLPDSESSVIGPGDFSCMTSATPQEAISFYRYFLEKQGWTVAEGVSANPAAMEFGRHGFRLSIHCDDAGDGKTHVTVHHEGNYDLRWIPKFDGAPIESVYEAANTVSYRTQAELVQIETTLLRQLPAAGWTGYIRLNSSLSDVPDQRQLNFLRNGTTLQVSIGRVPVDPQSYTIQYAQFFNHSSVPVPPDAGLVEFDGSTEPVLVATTALTLDQTRQFYDHELTTQGWLIRQIGRSLKDDHCWLSYLRQQSDLTIGLTKLPDGRTLVRVGKAVGSLWDHSQVKSPTVGTTVDGEGLEAADLPGLSAAQSAKFDADGKSVELQVGDATLAAVAQRYSESLAALGWTAGDGGIRAEDYTLLTFGKGGKEITLRARLQAGQAVVNFQGDGLLWNKEPPTGKQIVSYESWLRHHKHPAGLEWLDQYQTQMRAINAPRP